MKKEKSCGCIIMDGGKVLLVQEMEGHWGFPKGHVELGETELETAIRETKEETNLDVEIDDSKRYEINYLVSDDIDKTVVYFLGKKKNGNIIRQESEINSVEWIPYKEAIERITYDNAKGVLRQVLEEMKIEY